MNKIFSFILIVFIFIANAKTQQLPAKFTRVTVDQGLSQRTAWTMAQDNFGFMWFGTQDGLNKYDGINFTIYNSENYPALRSSAITDLLVDDNEIIWLCTSDGMCQYINKKDQIISLDIFPSVEYREIIKDYYNNYWIASDSGLFFYNPKSKTLKHFTSRVKNKNSLITNDIDCIFQDCNKNIWVGTMKGLNLLNPVDSSFYLIEDNSGTITLTGKRIAHLINAGSTAIIISVSNVEGGAVLYKYDPVKPYEGKFKLIAKGNSSRAFIDSKQRLWLGFGAGEGLKVLYPVPDGMNKPSVKSYYHDINNTFSLSDNTISDIYEDKMGDLWIGTFGNGVNYLSFSRKKFYHVYQEPNVKNTISNNIVNCFLEENNYFWIGTESGLNRIDKGTGIIKQYKHDPHNSGSISANAVYSIFKDSRGNLWIGTWNGGLNLYNYHTDNFISFRHDEDQSGTISSDNIFSIKEDKKGNLWIGTVGGRLNLYDYKTGNFIHYMNNPDDPESIGGNYIDCIYETSNGELWVSSYRELNKFDYSTQKFTKYSHQKNDKNSLTPGDIEMIYEDSHNHLWIGTAGGLNYFDRINNKFHRYTTDDGLPNNYIEGIIEDLSGNLWISTNKGLSKFNHGAHLPDSISFQNYSIGDGLQGSEFVKRSVYRDSKGYLYFGGINGYNYFYADSIINITHKNPVLITDLLLFNRKVKPGDNNNLLKENIITSEILKFKHFQSVFTIEFISLNYLNPLNSNYAFKLEGFEKEWNYVGNRRHATYTNLPAGVYTFRVKATNSDGIWNNDDTSLKIYILPAWWKTMLFRILFIVLIFLVIFIIYRLRFRRLERQKKLLEALVLERTIELSDTNVLLEESKEEVSMQNEELIKHRSHLEKLVEERTGELETALRKSEESDRLKTSFLANMSHEIRTPMNAIIGFSNLLSQEDLEKTEKDFYIKTIQNNGNSLLVLINDILDISQIEANQLSISKSIFNATEILDELLRYYSLTKKDEIELRIYTRLAGNEIFLDNDPVRFKQVLNNLLSNAFKYTNAGMIEVNIHLENTQIVFCVIDTGIGIDEENKKRIFERFYKIEDDEQILYRGTGLGLTISKSLISLMGGSIWVESEINRGSKFCFSLPYNSTLQNQSITEIKDQTPYSFEKLSVLIVEDEENNYWLLEKILKKKGITVYWAGNGKKAIAFIEEFKELEELIILMDIKMPVMNGYEAFKIIRSRYHTLPVIAVTAYAQKAEKEKILNTGFTDYLPKPIEEEKLFELIKKYYKPL